jgi:hypothetical protein
MRANPLVHRVLADEALTRGLGDEEARVLVEWLVERAEVLACQAEAVAAEQELRRLSRRCRAVGRFVLLWSARSSRGAALQLAGAERFVWPLPEGPVEPCELMEHILEWEGRQLGDRAA